MLLRHGHAFEQQPVGVPPPRTPYAVVAADASGMIIFVGEKNVGNLFGWPLDNISALSDLLGQMPALTPAPAVWAGEVECRHASGNWLTADVVVTPFHPRDRASAGVTLVCRPVTVQMPAAQAGPTGVGPGPSAMSAGSFGPEVLSKLGHELRSPLAAIIGLTGILLMRLAAADSACSLMFPWSRW